jgi:hypothetical protein
MRYGPKDFGFRFRYLQYKCGADAQVDSKALVQIRCDRGASIASQMSFPEPVAAAIYSLDEHWKLHHIGLSSLDAEYEKRIQALPARWMGAFGEGVAVLAAAGSPDVAPLSAYPPRDQIDWDLNMERVGAQIGGSEPILHRHHSWRPAQRCRRP